MPKKWIVGLDSIRFFLALWVVLSHVPISKYIKPYISQIHNAKLIEDILNTSFVGVAAVIIFFVLSGIVIHFPYRHNNTFNAYEFLFRRYFRIGIPMLMISLFASYYNRFYTLPFWSLYCELIYYTLYPLIFRLKQKFNINYIYLFTFIIAYVVLYLFSNSIRSFFTHEPFNGNYHELGIKYTWVLGLPCWILGVKIADTYDNLVRKKVSFKSITFWRIIIILSSCLCFVMRYKLWLSFSISLNVFSLIAYVWLSNEISYWAKHTPVAIFENAGKWSYSLYICHPLTSLFLGFIGWHNSFTISDFFLIVTSSFLISYIFFVIIEKPSIKLTSYLYNTIFSKK